MIRLWQGEIPGYDRSVGDQIPGLEPYLLSTSKRHGAVIVCPGGGYSHLAPHEGAPIAKWLNSIGISAFVLTYRIAPYKHPYPLLDAQRAIRYVRFHADEWCIDPNRIGILGFSAGGHLAATAGTHWDRGATSSAAEADLRTNSQADLDADVDPIDSVPCRPDAMILCYPVISFEKFGHVGSMHNLIGQSPDESLRLSLCNEAQVTEETPPAFIWHTADDQAVPVANSLAFARSLSEHGVPFELHVFPHGRHGLGLAEQYPEVAMWSSLCATWLKSMGFALSE